jgi:hypothetical protein
LRGRSAGGARSQRTRGENTVSEKVSTIHLISVDMVASRLYYNISASSGGASPAEGDGRKTDEMELTDV